MEMAVFQRSREQNGFHLKSSRDAHKVFQSRTALGSGDMGRYVITCIHLEYS